MTTIATIPDRSPVAVKAPVAPAPPNVAAAPGELEPQQAGFILVGVVMFMLALTILGLSLFSLSSYEGQFFYASVSREQSLHSSESGMEVVKALLAAPNSRLDHAQLAVGQFGITRALAYQRRSSNPNDTTSRGPVNWDSTLVIVVSARAGGEERTVESRFIPRSSKNPYQRLATCGLGFSYNNQNGGIRTVEMQGKVWQHVQYPADSAWTTYVNWLNGRPLDISMAPIPQADAFVDAKLPGATDLTGSVSSGSSGGSGATSYSLTLRNLGTSPRYYTLSTPQVVMDQSQDPERNWYGCFFDQRLTLNVKGTCILVVPDGACFDHEVVIQPDGSNASGTLVIVAKANGRQSGYENRGIWFEGGILHSNPNIKVFLVSQGDISVTHVHNSTNVNHESRALSIVCGGDLELMGPDPGWVFKLAYGGSAQDAVADDLMSRGALPAVTGGAGNSFAYARSTWLETRRP